MGTRGGVVFTGGISALAVFGADGVAHGGGNGFGRQAVVPQHFVGGAGVAELVLHAQAAHIAGQFFAEQAAA